MKLLVYTKDAPTLSSAYGRISDELFLQRLSRLHEIALFSTVGITDGAVEMTHADEHSLGAWLADHGEPSTPEAMLDMIRGAQRRVVVYPGVDPRDYAGELILQAHIKDFRPDMFWTAGDVWPFQRTAEMAARGLFVWGVWAFVDFDWDDPRGLLDHLAKAAVLVPTSVWLERRLRAMGLAPTPPVHLGVNVDAFMPLRGTTDDEGGVVTGERLKRAMSVPEDCFLVGMVQMNQLDRKPFEEQLEGFRLFRDANPDVKAKLYAHTFPMSQQGWDLRGLLAAMGLDRDSYFCDDYRWLKGVLGYGDLAMCKIYNAMDALLQATGGESPGMPLLEAQAAACPVVATDFVGIPEHVAGGELVRVRALYRPPERPQMAKALPDPDSIARQLEKVCNGSRETYGKKGRAFAESMSWDRCLEGWLRVLDDCSREIDRRTLVPPVASPALRALAGPA